jgi:hypothetical protein
MEQGVLTLHNLLVQLRISANDISEQEPPSIRNLFDQAYQEDPLPRRMLEAIGTKDILKEISIAECME